MRIRNIICPYCGAELEIEYISGKAPLYLYNCCVCGGTFKHTKEELDKLVKEMKKGKNQTVQIKDLSCPNCGSNDVGLWNSRKQTYHCHQCDNYFNKFGRVIGDNYNTRKNSGGRSVWNGFTDPDDFPTDGFGDGGW